MRSNQHEVRELIAFGHEPESGDLPGQASQARSRRQDADLAAVTFVGGEQVAQRLQQAPIALPTLCADVSDRAQNTRPKNDAAYLVGAIGGPLPNELPQRRLDLLLWTTTAMST